MFVIGLPRNAASQDPANWLGGLAGLPGLRQTARGRPRHAGAAGGHAGLRRGRRGSSRARAAPSTARRRSPPDPAVGRRAAARRTCRSTCRVTSAIERRCFPVIGGVRAYKDLTHVTPQFAYTLGPYLADELRRLWLASDRSAASLSRSSRSSCCARPLRLRARWRSASRTTPCSSNQVGLRASRRSTGRRRSGSRRSARTCCGRACSRAARPNQRTRPAKPRYDFSLFDALVDEARDRGHQGRAHAHRPGARAGPPRRSARSATRNPSAKEFARFATDVAKHFKGRVQRYSIWNEPNWHTWLSPAETAASSTARSTPAPTRRSSARTARPRSCSANSRRRPAPAPRSAPLRFMRDVLCVDAKYKKLKGSKCGRVRADAVSLHPYDYRQRADLEERADRRRHDRHRQPAHQRAHPLPPREGADHGQGPASQPCT